MAGAEVRIFTSVARAWVWACSVAVPLVGIDRAERIAEYGARRLVLVRIAARDGGWRWSTLRSAWAQARAEDAAR
jgi:hypothetical protein